jgi:hypothetical protein
MSYLKLKKVVLIGVALLLLALPVAACAPKAAEPPPQPPAPPAGTIAADPSKIDMTTLKTNFEILVKLRRYTPEVAAKLPVQLGLLVQPVKFVGEGWPANEMVFVDLVIPPDVEMKGLDRSRGEDSVGIAVGTADSEGRFEAIMEPAAKLNWLLRSDWLPTVTPDLSSLKPLPKGIYTIRATGIDPRTVATATWYLELAAPASK